MKSKTIIFWLLVSMLVILADNYLSAQKESYNWYFGSKAGISFIPDLNNTRVLFNCNVSFGFAGATISDKNGKLLFYTNGDNVIDSTHKAMPHSFNFTTFFSNPEGCLIVPVPGRIKQYYLFSTDSMSLSGFWYSIIDMAGNNGKGDVISKMNKVTRSRKSAVEAIVHKNNKDIWILTKDYFSDKFVAYLISQRGIIDSVVSNFNNIVGIQYYINSSVDGSALATASYNDSSFYLFDFDIQSGIVSNKMKLNSPDFERPTAVEFSSDGTKLYVDCLTSNLRGKIYQLDLSTRNESAIVSSRVLIEYNSNEGNYDALQLGPDNKIYCSYFRSGYLSVINNPNNSGTSCDFTKNSINLGDRQCYLNLPDFLYGYLHYGIGGSYSVCVGDNIYLFADFPDGATYSWTGPNGFSSNVQNPIINNASLTCSGYYRVTVNNIPDPITDSIYVSVVEPPIAAIINRNDTIICPGGSVVLDAYPRDAGMKYLWSTNDSTNSIKASKTGTYSVIVTNQNGCSDTAYKNVTELSHFFAKIGWSGGTQKCSGDTLQLHALPSDSGYKYFWSTGDTVPTISIKKTSIIDLTVSNAHGCKEKVSQRFEFLEPPGFSLSPKSNAEICEGETLTITIFTLDTTLKFKWSTGETSKKITVTKSGVYKVVGQNSGGCNSEDSVIVTVIPVITPKITADGPIVFCDGDSVVLTGTPWAADIYCQWSTGARSEKITVKSGGKFIYSVIGANGCSGSASTMVKVSSKLDAAIIGDSILCQGESIVLTAYPKGSNYIYLWSTGETSPIINISHPGDYWLKVYLNSNCNDSTGIKIIELEKPVISIISSGSGTICDGDSITLTASSSSDSLIYLWSTGDSTNKIKVKSQGKYTVTAYNVNGCKSSASLFVNVLPSFSTSITGNTSVCDGDSTVLIAEPSGAGFRYEWSTGDTTQSIEVTKEGKYSVKVSLNDRCFDSSTVDIVVNPKPKVYIIGELYFCKGDTVMLSTDKDFFSYLWSTGETGKSIRVNKQGAYTVKVTDSLGCNAFAKFELNSHDINITGLADIDFSSQQTTTSSNQTLNIKNESSEDVYIKKISLKQNSEDFDISTIPQLPSFLNPGGTLAIYIQFKPLSEKKYIDSLIIDIDQPCKQKLAFRITGEGIVQGGRTSIWLPDATAKIGDSNFCIPLMAKKDINFNYIGYLSYTAEIRFDASLFVPSNIPSTIAGNERILRLFGDSIQFTNSVIKLDEFCGNVFIGGQNFNTLRIVDFKWNTSLIENQTKNGSITLTGMCQPNLARLTLINDRNFSILENPVNDILRIKISNSLNTDEFAEVEIFSPIGMKVYAEVSGSEDAQEIRIDVSSIPSGMYFVRIGDKVCKFVKM